ncbi:MAG: ATP-binding cassette domain-containing protein [Thermodesulfobacteriota bacterium]
MTSEPLLVIDKLEVAVASNPHPKPLVRGVSLAVHAGEVLGLIGESGSGKSMTCLSVMRLLPNSVHRVGGRVLVDGSEMFARGRDVGMVMQNPASCFDQVMTIEGHFRETLAAHGVPWITGRPRALESLREAGFDEPASILPAYPFQLSGGMLQRVMIALAMVLRPKLLLADEPTTDLDMPAQARVLDLLDRLRQTHNLGILLVTHDLSVVARLADTVAVMHGGVILETGPVLSIFEAPAHEYTRKLLAAHFNLHDALSAQAPDRDERMANAGEWAA